MLAAMNLRSLLVLAMLVSACSKNDQPPPPSSGVPGAKPESGPSHGPAGQKTPAEQAASMYSLVCVMCHGPGGQGDGKMAASLNPKPRNYTDPNWQKSVTDDDIKKIILLGGKAVGKSDTMPGQPQLEKEPAVLDELVKIIRGFGPK